MLAGFKHEGVIELVEDLARIPITPQGFNLMLNAATSGIAASVR